MSLNNQNIQNSPLQDLQVLNEEKEYFNLEEVLKEAETFEKSPLYIIVELKKYLNEEKIRKIWSKKYNIPLMDVSSLKIKERYDNYILFENNIIGIMYPYLKNILEKKYPQATFTLIPYYMFELKDIEAEGYKGIFYQIIKDANKINATDIHFRIVGEESLKIKYRVLGELVNIKDYPLEQGKKLLKAIKTIATQYTYGFDPEEWQEPQDARISIKEMKLDLRLAFTPSLVDGVQNLVIRLLSKEQKQITSIEEIYKLGYFEDDAQMLLKFSNYKKGLNIMSGATGSGKSKTFNTLLALIKDNKNILTVEDPVEYKLTNAVQHQVREFIKDKGGKKEIVKVDYMAYIKAFMRQDPDIIMIGEWRKMPELTEALLYASETGHLVFTTLHASRAINAINLLVSQYGLNKEDVINNINVIINQRLVKRVCPHCSLDYTVTKEDIENIKELITFKDKGKLDALVGQTIKIKNDDGCEKCRVLNADGKVLTAGYLGRTVIYEYLVLDETIKRIITKTTSSMEIENEMIEDNNISKTYVDIALKKVLTHQLDLEQLKEGLL